MEGSKGNDVSRALSYLGSLLPAQASSAPDLENRLMGDEGFQRPDPKKAVLLMFSDRAKAEKAIVKQLLNEIALRQGIHDDIFQRIDEDMCKCGTWLREISAITDKQYAPPEESLAFGTRKTTIELKLLDLEGEKREEDLKAWEDLSKLRRYLLFALRDYWTAARRSELLRPAEER